MTHILGKAGEHICRGCGCTDSDACVTADGPCAWVLLDAQTPTGICSACAAELQCGIRRRWQRPVCRKLSSRSVVRERPHE